MPRFSDKPCSVSELEIEQQKCIAELREKLETAQRQLDLLIRHVFGKKSDRTPTPPVPGQMDLELETENAAIESEPPLKPKGGSRKGRKIRGALLPDDLPVEETVLIPAAVQAGCRAHVRRKFFDGAKDGCLICKSILRLINVL